jgi:hypothetical protein
MARTAPQPTQKLQADLVALQRELEELVSRAKSAAGTTKDRPVTELTEYLVAGPSARSVTSYTSQGLAETNTVEVCDDGRKLLKTVAFPSDEKGAAA